MSGFSRTSPLACSVRGCARPLERRPRTWVCAAGHSYDIARAGYVNLLQPQDRRSRTAGDSKEAVAARESLMAAGVARSLTDSLAAQVLQLHLPYDAVLVDLGCGAGDVLAALSGSDAITGIGIDLSTAAADRAARRYPRLTWVVANADRRLPLLDASVDLVVSVHGRRNPNEAARVLKPGSHTLVAVPAHDDLIELREVVQGQRVERERIDAIVSEHSSFRLVGRSVVRETMTLDRDSLRNLLTGTYRGVRRAAAERVAALSTMNVTLASEVFLLQLREDRRAPRHRR